MRTSYFSRAGRHPFAISICRSAPRWFKGAKYMELAPSWDLIKENDLEVYKRRYREEVLSKLDPEVVVKELRAIYREPILLCYEKPPLFCHRHEVAKWIRESLGLGVHELDHVDLLFPVK